MDNDGGGEAKHSKCSPSPTGLPVSKQLQIEAFLKYNQCDIINLQEANIDFERFSTCDFIQSSYKILENNSTNKYGTASLVKSDLQTKNLREG